LDRVEHPIHAAFPASGRAYWQRLRYASVFDETARLVEHPIREEGPVVELAGRTLVAARLDHRVEAFGYRLTEPDGRRMLPEKLAEYGLRGPIVGDLQRAGQVIAPSGQVVTLDQVSEVRAGKKVAFVMDTRPCPGALALAKDVDLLVCESTFLASEAEEAVAYGHMTAADAGELAARAGARRLVLTHFSQRYNDLRPFAVEAGRFHDDVVVAEDGLVVPW
jgi:ribonuclease Z